MTISISSVTTIVSSVFTWTHAGMAVLGAFGHKIYSKFIGAEKKAQAALIAAIKKI